jgi:hypothetical protein
LNSQRVCTAVTFTILSLNSDWRKKRELPPIVHH